MSGGRIRLLEAGDVGPVAALMGRVFAAEYRRLLGDRPLACAWLVEREVTQYAGRPDDFGLVAFAGGELLGMVLARLRHPGPVLELDDYRRHLGAAALARLLLMSAWLPEPAAGEGDAVLEGLAVEPARRFWGLGMTLMEQAAVEAAARGARRVRLTMHRDTPILPGLLARCGYRRRRRVDPRLLLSGMQDLVRPL